MKMRKVWAMLTAGAMCFGLMAGCSNDAGTDSQAPTTAIPSSPSPRATSSPRPPLERLAAPSHWVSLAR